MSLTPEQVEHVAKLARLALTPEEVELYTRQLAQILAHMQVLSRVDVSGVEPTFHVIPELANVMRPDVSRPGLGAESAVANAPEQAAGYFRVPRMGKEG
jgi:aspartyl-tRNA(Asn)/glutamyl-tRNA(Gln) amidotransferase subunit C